MVLCSGGEGGLQGAQCRHEDAKDLDGGDKGVGVVTVLARQILGGEGGLGWGLG